MTSQFAYSIHQTRHQLIAALVQRLLPVQPDDDNYGLALDFCLQKAYHHTFPDINPRETEAFYAGLVHRLEGDSQLTKAAALSAFVSKLLALKLQSPVGVHDLNQNLLQLLASLSQQPLSSNLELTADVMDLLYKPAGVLAAAEQQEQRQEQTVQSPGVNRFQRMLKHAAGNAASAAGTCSSTAGSDGSPEYDPYNDDSSLSDWDEEDRRLQHHWAADASSSDSEAQHQLEQQQQLGEETAEGGQGQQGNTLALVPQSAHEAAGWCAAAPGMRLAVPPLPPGCAVLGPQHLLTNLSAVQHKAGPLLHQFCLSQHFLAQQVLRVLQGLPAQGFILLDPYDLAQPHSQHTQQQQPGRGSMSVGAAISSGLNKWNSAQHFTVDLRITSPCLSTACLHALLKEVAVAGTHARQLRALVQQLAYGSKVGNGVLITPCLRALGVALQQQLDLLGMQLALQQQELQQRQAASNTSTSADTTRPQQQSERHTGVTLARLVKSQVRPIMTRLQLLHSTLFGTVLPQLAGPPAAVSAALIDGLEASVRAAATCRGSGPEGPAGAAALLHLLLSSCVPLTRALGQWLWCALDGAPGQQQGLPQQVARSTLQQWHRQQGGPSVCGEDFFIVRCGPQDMPAVDPDFWHTAYSFSRHMHDAAGGSQAWPSVPGQPGSICCPSFLAPVVNSIMTAGKSMRLLEHMEQEELKSSNLCSANNNSSSSSRSAAMTISPGTAHAPLLTGPAATAAVAPQSGSSTVPAALLHRPSTPRRRRRPSSAGASLSSSGAAGGGLGPAQTGRLSRQHSLTDQQPGRQRPAGAAAADSSAATLQSPPGRKEGRRKWGDAAGAGHHTGGPAAGDTNGISALSGSRAVSHQQRAAAVSQRVKAQLAAAAAVAGKQVQQELPADFISTACYVLQQEQQLQARALDKVRQCHKHLNSSSSGSCVQTSCTSAGDVLMPRLKAVANSLTHPNQQADDQEEQLQHHSLREAMAALRSQRITGGAAVSHQSQQQQLLQVVASCQPDQQQDNAAQSPPAATAAAAAVVVDSSPPATPVTPTARGQEAVAADLAGGAVQAEHPAAATSSTQEGLVDSGMNGSGSSGMQQPQQQLDNPSKSSTPFQAASSAAADGADMTPHQEAEPNAAAALSTGDSSLPAPTEAVAAAAAAMDAGNVPVSPDVPRLTAWRDQLEGRLAAAGQQLQRMAPWQQAGASGDNGGEDDARTKHHCDDNSKHQQQKQRPGGSSSQQGGSSSSSWLLRAGHTQVPGHFTGSLAELWPLQPVSGLSRAVGTSRGSWLRAAAWPGSELDWLLHDPPTHLPAVDQLLSCALIQPLQARVELVDRQLMSSLMGEWGMLQQLQGLINVFLIASPAVVEWVDTAFTAVEAAKPSATNIRAQAAGSPNRPGRGLLAAGASGVCGGAGRVGAGLAADAADGLPAVSSDGTGVGVGVEDLDLLSLEAVLQDCVLSAGPNEVLPDPDMLLLAFNKEALVTFRLEQQRRQMIHKAGASSSAAAAAAATAAAQARERLSSPSRGSSIQKDINANITGGLMQCSKEWIGLSLQHAGSWQLSLVYTDQQLKMFGRVWLLMLQLRWVRRRVHQAEFMACKGGADVNKAAARDSREAAEVTAAVAAAAADAAKGNSRLGAQQAGSCYPIGAAGGSSSSRHAALSGLLDWLSGREELLLLQEVGCFMTQWHSYIMQAIMDKGWPELQQVLVSAKGLDQVLAATAAFFTQLCSLCNLQAPGSSSQRLRDSNTRSLQGLMDSALAAAAAAGRVHAARQKLEELRDLPGREVDLRAWWLELGAARSRLKQARRDWDGALHPLLGMWALLKQHAYEDLQASLDMNGYFARKQAAWDRSERLRAMAAAACRP